MKLTIRPHEQLAHRSKIRVHPPDGASARVLEHLNLECRFDRSTSISDILSRIILAILSLRRLLSYSPIVSPVKLIDKSFKL